MTNRRSDGFASGEEAAFFANAKQIIEAVPCLRGYMMESVIYEGLAFNLPGGVRYTPDFIIRMSNDHSIIQVVVEIKGSKRQRHYRETHARVRNVSALYPQFAFLEVFMSRGKVKDIEIVNTPIYNMVVSPKV